MPTFPLALDAVSLRRPYTDITADVLRGVAADGGDDPVAQAASVDGALAAWATDGAARTTAITSVPARRAAVVAWVESRAFAACAVDMETNPSRWQAPDGEGGHEWNLAVQLRAMQTRSAMKRAEFDAALDAARPSSAPPTRGAQGGTMAVQNIFYP